MTPRLIDTHCHIHDAHFGDDAGASIERAREAGIELMLTLGENAANSRIAIALAERHDSVLAAAGVHPHDAKDATDADLRDIEAMAEHPRVAAIGEIGLDYYRNLSPRADQQRVLRCCLDIAARASKPVAVHAREAHEDVLPMLTAWSRELGGALPDGRPLGILHYFSGDAALARKYIALGYLISVHTSVTHPKARLLQDVVREIPLDCVVLETDSPFGAPQRYRGSRNEPAYVAEAAAKVAELKGLTTAEVAETTTRNALRLLTPAAVRA